jgi:hypothetical protein
METKIIIFGILAAIIFVVFIAPVNGMSVTYPVVHEGSIRYYFSGGTSWSTIHDGTTGTSITTAGDSFTAINTYSTADKFKEIRRGFLVFDTRTLGGSASDLQGTLCLYGGNPSYILNNLVPNHYVAFGLIDGSSIPPVVADYNNFNDNIYGADWNWSSGVWRNITIPGEYILNPGGYSVIGIRHWNDWSNVAPTWLESAWDELSWSDAVLIVEDAGEEASDGNYEVRVAGLDTDPISGALVELWYNGALQHSNTTGSTGTILYDIPPYRTVNGTVSKSGYQNATFSQYINTWDTWSTVILYADDETPGTGDEYWTYAATFRDANTHENLDLVFIDLYTDSDREDLFLSEYRNGGVWTGLLPNDTTFYATASATNYVDLEWSFTINGASQSVFKDLIPVTYGSLQPVLNIFVYDTGGTPLNDAGVTIDSDIDDGFHLTNSTGYARHFCDNLAYGSLRNYTITAEKGGYITESSTVTVSTQQPTVYIFMEKSTVATVTPTGVYTPVVTPVWSGDGGTPGNIKEQLINTVMTQFGVSQLEANILMGIILTLLCAVTVGGGLASYGSGSGAGVGAMIGAVVGFSGSSIIGFFPIWILIVVIVLVFAAWFMFRGRDE